jgi:hypothetical protein
MREKNKLYFNIKFMKKLTTIIFLMFSLLLVNSVNASLLEANNETGS